MWDKIKEYWTKFEEWVHSWFPGLKTYILTGLGAASQFAALSYEYIQGLPATKWISQEALTATAAVLFTLSFWTNRMGDRVQAAKDVEK